MIWSRTFQNVKRQLLTWGTVFAAYPDLKIVHCVGRVHSNVDPISRLQRNVPIQDGPAIDDLVYATLNEQQETLTKFYEKIASQFEARTLKLVAAFEEDQSAVPPDIYGTQIQIASNLGKALKIDYCTARSYNLVTHLDAAEVECFVDGYQQDSFFKKILEELHTKNNWSNPAQPLYFKGENGMLYFEDWNGNMRLCIPRIEQIPLTREVHNELTKGVHAVYHKMYNKIAGTYFWPKMSKQVKRYVTSCDICQKAKPQRHAATGLLQPLPIPEWPFEVLSMDFIPEFPMSSGFNNIMVIVNKLTTLVMLIPTQSTVTETEAAELFFKHIETLNRRESTIAGDLLWRIRT